MFDDGHYSQSANQTAADIFFHYYYYFSEKIGLDICLADDSLIMSSPIFSGK